MAYYSHDTLVPCTSLTGKSIQDAVQDTWFTPWIDEFAEFDNKNKNPNTPILKKCYYYMLAHPPTWRRYGCLPPGAKPQLLFVFDTETTSLFPVKKVTTIGANGKPYINSVKGTGTGLPKNKMYTPDIELLQIAWAIVDPRTFETVASYSTLVQPTTYPSKIYNMELYAEAVKEGVPLRDAMQTLMSTLKHWDATHDMLVCAHNVAFDRKVVAMSLSRSGIDPDASWLAHSFHCTMDSVQALGGAEYHAWARAHFPHHYLNRRSLEAVLTHRGVPYASTDETKELKRLVNSLRPGEFEQHACVFEPTGDTWSPNLQYLFIFLTHRDIVQTHRADEDVNMLVACIPELLRRGWFKLPPTHETPVPNETPVPIPVRIQKKTTSPPKKVSRSVASKHTSVSTPIRRSYFLRSHGPAPVLCL